VEFICLERRLIIELDGGQHLERQAAAAQGVASQRFFISPSPYPLPIRGEGNPIPIPVSSRQGRGNQKDSSAISYEGGEPGRGLIRLALQDGIFIGGHSPPYIDPERIFYDR
jgi:hypothetical protein